MKAGAASALGPMGLAGAAPLHMHRRRARPWLRENSAWLYVAANRTDCFKRILRDERIVLQNRSEQKIRPTSGKKSFYSMADEPSDTSTGSHISAVLLQQRNRILHFLRLRGAGDSAEDFYQELWMRLSHRVMDDIADPISYVMRAANNLMLDHYRSNRQREARDLAWGEYMSRTEASSENRVIAEQQLHLLDQKIRAVGDRPAHIFRRFRLDNVAQKDIAAEMGVSLSTVEADLRKVYAVIAAARRQFDAQ